jgi:hypothetical protein
MAAYPCPADSDRWHVVHSVWGGGGVAGRDPIQYSLSQLFRKIDNFQTIFIALIVGV